MASKPDRFKNKAFRRGHRDALADIQRKHSRGNVDSSKAKSQTKYVKPEEPKSHDIDPGKLDLFTARVSFGFTTWLRVVLSMKYCLFLDKNAEFFDFVTRNDFNQLMKVVGELRGEIVNLKRKREERNYGCDPEVAAPPLPRCGSSEFWGRRRYDNAKRLS